MKKHNRLLSLALVLVLTLALTAAVTADNVATSNQLRLGDANGDGIINAADALEVLQFAVGKRTAFSAEEGEETVTGLRPDDGTNDILNSDMIEFQTLEAFQKYLKNAKTDLDAEYVATVHENAVEYCQPIQTEPLYVLSNIVIETRSIVYNYHFGSRGSRSDGLPYAGPCDLYVSCFVNHPMGRATINEVFQKAEDKANTLYTVVESNGIRYCYGPVNSFGYVNVYWTIGDNSFYARCQMVENETTHTPADILPYLAIETVTLPLQ